MNPLQALNAKEEKAARKRTLNFVLKRKVAAATLLLSCLFIAMCVSNQMRHASPATVEIADAAQASASDLSAFAATVEEPLRVQKVAVYPFAKTFDEQLSKSQVTRERLSYLPGKEIHKMRIASHSRDVSFAPKSAVHASAAKTHLSSDNWAQMTGGQRWKFVEAYINTQHWKCPQSGMSTEAEIQKLSNPNITWWMVRNFGLNKCIRRS